MSERVNQEPLRFDDGFDTLREQYGPFLTTKQVCEVLQCSVETVRKARATGRLRAVRLVGSRSWQHPVDQLIADLKLTASDGLPWQ